MSAVSVDYGDITNAARALLVLIALSVMFGVVFALALPSPVENSTLWAIAGKLASATSLIGATWFGIRGRVAQVLSAPPHSCSRSTLSRSAIGCSLLAVGASVALHTQLAPSERLNGPAVLVEILGAFLLIPPLEEAFFRGVLLRGLMSRLSSSVAVGTSAFLFALFHLPLGPALTMCILGVALGLIFIETGSIWICTIGHSSWNASVFVMEQLFFPSQLYPIPNYLAWMSSGATMVLGGLIVASVGSGATRR